MPENRYSAALRSAPFILSWPKLVEREKKEDGSKGKFKFQCNFPKNMEAEDKEDFDNMIASICQAAGVDDIDEIGKGKSPESHPFLDKFLEFRDGDNTDDPTLKGMVWCNIHPKDRPVLMDASKSDDPVPVEVEDIESVFYAGAKCIFLGQAAFWANRNKVGFTCDMIVKLDDGPRLGQGSGFNADKAIAGLDLGRYRNTPIDAQPMDDEDEDEVIETEAEEVKETPKPKAKAKPKAKKAAAKTSSLKNLMG